MAETGSLAEPQLRIKYHRKGGVVAGWIKCNIRLSSVSKDRGRGLGFAELGNKKYVCKVYFQKTAKLIK